MAKGFAAYILFMRSTLKEDGTYAGKINGNEYIINDQHAAELYLKWNRFEGLELVKNILSDESLWEKSLNDIPGFAEAVYNNMDVLRSTNNNVAAGTV
jgi:tagaturonate reductase